MVVRFNQPPIACADLAALTERWPLQTISGNGPAGSRCENLLSSLVGVSALLTTSCTHALEVASILTELKEGDEVIMPSFSFVSMATAVTLRGARPVFCDIDTNTLNIDVNQIHDLISRKTRGIWYINYAGVGVDPATFPDRVFDLGLWKIEDNAHGLGGSINGKPLGSLGDISVTSFHETKNISCGEGGAIWIKNQDLFERAEVLREKGTDRSKFFRGQVDKYRWVDLGSSWVISDILSIILEQQIMRLEEINSRRLFLWNAYLRELETWCSQNSVKPPQVPINSVHTGHIFHLRLPSLSERTRFIAHLQSHGVSAVFHYQALHDSPFSKKGGYFHHTNMRNSLLAADTLVRLPLYHQLSDSAFEQVVHAVKSFKCS